jgi:hypothetical protein
MNNYLAGYSSLLSIVVSLTCTQAMLSALQKVANEKCTVNKKNQQVLIAGNKKL